MKFEPGHYKLFEPQDAEWRELAESSGYDFSALDKVVRACIAEIKAQEPPGLPSHLSSMADSASGSTT